MSNDIRIATSCKTYLIFDYRFVGRRSPLKRDGSNGPGIRRHARAELSAHTAAAGEGRRQLQAHVGADQGQLPSQTAPRREATVAGTGQLVKSSMEMLVQTDRSKGYNILAGKLRVTNLINQLLVFIYLSIDANITFVL